VAIQEGTRKLLAHVAVQMGGVDRLADKLGISARLLNLYITGKEHIPDSLFLRVVDVVLEKQPTRRTPG
jgi:hypothetical protein